MQYSIIEKSKLDKIVFRIDAEYYQPEYLELEKSLSKIARISIKDANAEFDCSAFYPSLVQYYNFYGEGIPFLRVNEIQNGLLHITDETAFIPRQILVENQTTIALCHPGDIIIAKGGNSLAKVALLTNEYNEYSVSRDIIILSTSRLLGIKRYYLWMFLHSNKGKQLLLRTASQTGQPHLTLEALKFIRVPLFSSDFQYKIKWLYNKSRELMSSSIQIYKEAEAILYKELKLSLLDKKDQLSYLENYKCLVVANRFDAEHFHPKYSELVEHLKSNSEYLTRIDSIELFNRRGVQPKYDSKESIDVVTSKHILEYGLDEGNFDNTKVINWENNPQSRILQGDILTYTTGANIGRTACYQSERKALASNHVNILRITSESPIYVAFLMNSRIGRMQTTQYSSGSAQAELYPQHISNFYIPFINRAKQFEIIEAVEKSRLLRIGSNDLLGYSRLIINMAIEQNEESALKWLENKIKKLELSQ